MRPIFRPSLLAPRHSAAWTIPLALLLAALGTSALAGCGTGGADPLDDRQAIDQGESVQALPTPVGRGAPLPEGFDSGPPAAPTRFPVKMSSPDYGMQAFLWWRPEVAERDLGLLADMKFRWVKQIFGWRDIELDKGTFDWERSDRIVEQAETFGLQLMVRVDHQPNWARAGCSLMGPPDDLRDWDDFLGEVAQRYAGRIDAYQIWNEPNLAREWCDLAPSPAGYAEMLATSYRTIKAADPRALVISAGLSPTGSQPPVAMPDDSYLESLYEAMGGSSDGHFDVLGVHAAGFAAAPEISPAEAAANKAQYGGERFFTFRRVEDLRAIQERFGDGDKQVAVLEMGWTSDSIHPEYAWHAVSEETKADYLVRAYQYAAENWTPWIGVMSAIFICDQDWTRDNEQYWWCITDPDGRPRPAYAALRDMLKVPQ